MRWFTGFQGRGLLRTATLSVLTWDSSIGGLSSIWRKRFPSGKSRPKMRYSLKKRKWHSKRGSRRHARKRESAPLEMRSRKSDVRKITAWWKFWEDTASGTKFTKLLMFRITEIPMTDRR